MNKFQLEVLQMNRNNFFTYETVKFTDVYNDATEFLKDYSEVGIPTTISVENATTLFYLLYAKYGNSTISFTDVTQFKYNVFSTIFMYGPTWEERLKLQKKLRELSDEEIMQGSKAIYNNALNPGTAPSTNDLEELNFINSQNTTNYKKSKMEAIAFKWDLLATDVTSEFLNKFKSLFRKILDPQNATLFDIPID